MTQFTFHITNGPDTGKISVQLDTNAQDMTELTREHVRLALAGIPRSAGTWVVKEEK